MKIEDLVKRSLNKIEAPTTRKKAMLNTIFEQVHSKDETGVKKVHIAKPKNFIFASAAVAVAAIVTVLLITLQPDDHQNIAATSPIATQPAAEEQLASEYGNPAWLHNLVISDEAANTSFPQEFALYEDVPIEISEEELTMIEQNLKANGWYETKGTSTDIGGLYFMSQSDGEPIFVTEPGGHEAMAQAFMEDSGLLALLESKGMRLELEKKEPMIIPENVETEEKMAEGASAESMFWSMADGIRSSGYVRLSVSANKHVLDCKIFAVRSVLITKAQTLPISKAIEHAFIPGGIGMPRDGNQVYTIIGVQLVYKHGVPLYELTLLIDEDTNYHPTAYALAVDEAVINLHGSSAAVYAAFVNEGV